MEYLLKRIVIIFLIFLFGCVSSDGGGDSSSEENPPSIEEHSLTVYLDNSGNKLSGFLGDIISEEILVMGDDVSGDAGFSYVVSGLDGMTADVEGNLSYSIPESFSAGMSKDFQILVTSKSGETGLFNGSVYVMQRYNLGEGTVGVAGGIVSSDSGSVVLSVEANALGEDMNVSISNGCDSSGNPEISVLSSVGFDGEFNISLPDPQDLDEELNCVSASIQSSLITKNFLSILAYSSSFDECGEYKWGTFQYVWQCEKKYFSKVRNFRLDALQSGEEIKETCNSPFGLLCLRVKPGASLFSSVSINDASLFEKEPVLFIHGYVQGDKMGRGKDTWNLFPQLLEESGDYLSFEFKWRTNARFQDVAEDLVSALELINEKTGKKVHIIAHSFGGILARTVLQKLNETDGTSYVASLITFGTPHSGIFDSEKEMHGVNFPKGQDGTFIHNFCRQISCYQMGEDVKFSPLGTGSYIEPLIESIIKSLVGVDSNEGKLAADLADVWSNQLPNDFSMKIVIGMTAGRNGDGLISYNGQRFHPLLKETNSLMDGEGGVTEVVLGGSYKHSSAVWWIRNTSTEVGVDSVSHENFKLAIEWLSDNFSFSEDFESGSLGAHWKTNSTGSGRIQVTSSNNPYGGDYHLTMDSSLDGDYSLNELILSVNLAGKSEMVLSFYHKEYQDEGNQMSDSFTGSENSDGVAVSVDGNTWYKAQGLTSIENVLSSYKLFYVDIDAVFLTHGLSYSNPVYFKFQQYDNYTISSDGFAFDNVQIRSVDDIQAIANAGSDQSVITGSMVTLDGSQSIGFGLTYSWSFISKPSGSSAILYGSNSINPTFKADASGTYVVQLVLGSGESDTVSIVANIPSGVAYDSVTGLMWQDNGYSPELYWGDAINYCNNLILGGYSDWRLPSVNELCGVSSRLTIFDSFFSEYWTSDYISNPNTIADFITYYNNGCLIAGWDVRFYDSHVRCVRD